MKCRHVSMFMMTVTLAYSAPIQYEYETLEVSTQSKSIPRQADDTPGKCCSDRSQRCCPYDYDDRCETMNNRTLCGYNKNQKNTENEFFFTKFGLPCRINDDRVECGYNGPYVTDVTESLPNTPAGKPSGCCNCCNEQTKVETPASENATVTFTQPATETTVETTTFTPEPTESSTEIQEFAETDAENIDTTYKKLIYISTTEKSSSAITCVTVEEKCHIVYEQPCILDPPCRNDDY